MGYRSSRDSEGLRDGDKSRLGRTHDVTISLTRAHRLSRVQSARKVRRRPPTGFPESRFDHIKATTSMEFSYETRFELRDRKMIRSTVLHERLAALPSASPFSLFGILLNVIHVGLGPTDFLVLRDRPNRAPITVRRNESAQGQTHVHTQEIGANGRGEGHHGRGQTHDSVDAAQGKEPAR
jgi:hypothetical protein